MIFQIMSLSLGGEQVDAGCDLDLLKNVSSSACQDSSELWINHIICDHQRQDNNHQVLSAWDTLLITL